MSRPLTVTIRVYPMGGADALSELSIPGWLTPQARVALLEHAHEVVAGALDEARREVVPDGR